MESNADLGSTTAEPVSLDITPHQFAGLCALAFMLMASYHIAMPTSTALFMQHYTSAMLPQAYLCAAVGAPLLALLVQRLNQRVSVLRAFVITAYLSCAILTALLLLYGLDVPGTAFALYIWRDLYVVLLVELFWTFANVAFAIRTASKLYGWFGAAGSIGGISTSMVVGMLAHRYGTLSTLWLTLPVLLVVPFGASRLAPSITARARAPRRPEAMQGGLAVLRGSPYLLLMLGTVIIIQGVVTIVDFQFTAVVGNTYLDSADRTKIFADMHGYIGMGALLLQVITSHILRYVGVARIWVGIPVLLALHIGAFLAMPRFAAMAVLKLNSKVLDYSIFRAAKEILYIPLSYAEKTQGKAIIDMAAYRVAKGAAALLILTLGTKSAVQGISLANLALCLVWLCFSLILARLYRRAAGAGRPVAGDGVVAADEAQPSEAQKNLISRKFYGAGSA